MTKTAGPVLVSGATGNVGGEVVAALAATGVPVRALVRDAASAVLPPGAVPVLGDLNRPDSLGAAVEGAGAVFLLPGFADMPGVLRQCHDAGVGRVVLLSGSSVDDGDPDNAISTFMRDSEAAVRAAGIAWTILRPSGFMSNTLQWVPQVRAGDVISAPFADVPIAMIDPVDIAAVAASALTEDGHDGEVYRISGPESLRPADRVRILGRVLDRPLRFVAQTDEQARAEMLATTPPRYVDAFFRFYVDGTLDDSVVFPTVRQISGRAPRTFEQWATAHADDFQGQ